MDEINKYRILNKLKSVYRMNSVDTRKESSAEHSWGCLMLADFFLSQMKENTLDRLKIYELLMYHDVVEIEAGDTPFNPDMQETNDKEEKERKAAEFLHKELPIHINDKFMRLFNEFETLSTPEARFAKAIDTFEAQIHELDYIEDWVGWTKEFIVEKKSKYFEEFSVLKTAFNKFLEYASVRGYFNQ